MKKIWGRVGVTIEMPDQQYEELLKAYVSDEKCDAGKAAAMVTKLLSDSSAAKLDGETYFPEAGVFGSNPGNDNPKFEMCFDLDGSREPKPGNAGYSLPVSPGTPVYVIERCYCGSAYANRCRMRNGVTDKRNKAVAIISVPEAPNRSYSVRCQKVYERPFDPRKHLARWGKTIFATLEEAKDRAKEKLNEGNT